MRNFFDFNVQLLSRDARTGELLTDSQKLAAEYVAKLAILDWNGESTPMHIESALAIVSLRESTFFEVSVFHNENHYLVLGGGIKQYIENDNKDLGIAMILGEYFKSHDQALEWASLN